MHRSTWLFCLCLSIAVTTSAESKFAEPFVNTSDPKCKEAITTGLAPFDAVLSQCFSSSSLYFSSAQDVCSEQCKSTTQQAAAIVSAGCEQPLDAANVQVPVGNPPVTKRSFTDDQSHVYAAWGNKEIMDAACAPSSLPGGGTCLEEYKKLEFALESIDGSPPANPDPNLACTPCLKNLVQKVGIPGREPRLYFQDVRNSTEMFSAIRTACGL